MHADTECACMPARAPSVLHSSIPSAHAHAHATMGPTMMMGYAHAGCYVYGRSFNPTVRNLGRLLARLEDTEAAHPCASGAVQCHAARCRAPSACTGGPLAGGVHELVRLLCGMHA